MFDSVSDARQEHVARKIEEFDLPHSNEEDVVAGTYRVQPHQQISELSNDYCRYYLATHKDTNQEFYAIVFERSFCPDHKMIKAITNSKESLFIKPLAASITRLSTNKIKHLTLIVDKYDHKENLKAKIHEIEEYDSRYITSKVLPFICQILQFCETNNLNCGNICPDNILVLEDDKFILREPYIAYPHSLQEIQYLSTEILDADYAGRKTSSISADIFAAGVTFLEIFFKGLSFPEGIQKLKQDRLNNGSFLSTIGKKRVSDDIKNHIKGCLNDNVNERWKLRNLLDWSSGKLSISKTTQNSDSSDIFAAVSFNSNNYYHYRALASALFHQWDAGLNFLSEDRVLKWIQRGTGKSKIIDYLDELTSREYATHGFAKAFIDKDERLFKAIMALDAQGPFRLNNFASHTSSLCNMFHYGFARQKKYIQDNVVKIALKKSWEDQLKYNSKEDIDTIKVNLLNELTGFYNSQTQGCGIERVLYHLNPSLPCLSPIVYNEYVTSLRALLVLLDNMSATSSEKVIFDKHIISFIANKINLKREVYINMLKDVPMKQENLSLYGLAIIVLAINHDPDLELTNLSALIGMRISEFTDKTLHNVRLKKNIDDKIKNASEESDFATMLKIVTNPKVYINDQSGYYKACRDVNMINKKITALTNNEEVKQFGTLFGQRITVLVSYMLFIIISIFMVI
jgi:hypothetical protein